MMNESISHEIGKHNLTPIEAMVINMHLPFGTKLELESNFKKSRIPKFRKRKVLFKASNQKSKLIRLKYEGQPLQSPSISMFSRCLLAYKKIISNQLSLPLRSNQNSSIPSLDIIEARLLNKQYKTFYEFKKALRQLWLYYYINFEKRQEVIQQVGLLSQLSEDILREIEAMNEEQVEFKLHEEEHPVSNKMASMKNHNVSPYVDQSSYINDKLSHNSINSNQLMHPGMNNIPMSNLPMINGPTYMGLSKKIIIYKEMSLEDKFKLNQKVNKLDQRQLMGIIPLLSDNDNQQMEYFEFDIDSLSALQLNKLQKYVNDCLAENSRTVNEYSIGNNNSNIGNMGNISNANINNYSYPKENSVIQPMENSNKAFQRNYMQIAPVPPNQYNYTRQPIPNQNIKHSLPMAMEEINNKSSDDSGSFDYH